MNALPPSPIDHDVPTAAIDVSTLIERCMDDISFALVLLAEFESGGEQCIEEIRRHAVSGDCARVADAAHALVGTAATLGAEPLRRAAAALEIAGRAGDLEKVDSLAVHLRDEMARCLTDAAAIRTQAAAAENRA